MISEEFTVILDALSGYAGMIRDNTIDDTGRLKLATISEDIISAYHARRLNRPEYEALNGIYFYLIDSNKKLYD